LFERRGKGTNLRLPQDFDNYPKSPLWGNILLLHHSALRVPTNGILKNRVATIKKVFLRHYRGSSKRFFTFVSFSFSLDFAIVFLSVLALFVLAMASASKVNDDLSNFKQYTNDSLLEA
jgi:hypothetical protein